MRRVIGLTTALAAAALFSLPGSSQAQTTQPPAASSAQTQSEQQADSPQAHLREAEEALQGIPPASVTGKAKTRINELKQHLNKLERAAASGDRASATGAEQRSETATAAQGKVNWQTEVAAIDRILSELLGNESASGSATGTAGTAGTSGTTGAKGSATASSAQLDEATRSKLTEVRRHVTAFAAAMGRGGASDAPETSAAAAAAAASPTAANQAATPPATANGTPGATGTTGTSGSTSTGSPESSSSASQPPSSATSAQSQGADPEAAKRHLTAARDALSQMTQLPAAAQLTGEARAQVSQLISNFNTLITTNTDWPTAYAKVEANLNALIGSQTTDESPAPATGTAGAVGTSGTVELDASLKAKLVEFRNHLQQFEQAAGGASAASSTEPGAAPSTAAAPTTTHAPGSAAATHTGTQPETQPGTQSAAQTAAQTGAQTATETGTQTGTMSREEAMRHIQAIEAILSGQPAASSATGAAGTTGTTGTSGSAMTSSASTSPVTLDSAKLQQLRMHLDELKRIINER